MIDKNYLIEKRNEIQKECLARFCGKSVAKYATGIQFKDVYMIVFCNKDDVEVFPKDVDELVLMSRFSAYDCLLGNMLSDLNNM